ncbi:molybdenum cofactor sulfurase isoform X2 [Scyliorhinus canicula]|uniref:molybdenum cofactor sulfurase isoform X2 n=1 Tax=Scyliorhinus canicula TaxID=7830 RepID=UPI0018F42944|nr:molybdenum cofactor sulfurase isoform X2 [Scyliorhinus canicula]XP_038653615.1 molybdenum cofactor sulfurase isoform X2 [Scyliorhinus canicula]
MIDTCLFHSPRITYLDHGGATLYSHSQINHFYQDLAENIYGNPHSANIASRLTHDTIERVRYRILQHFNTSPEEYTIIFTSGSTAALKLVAESFQWICTESGDSKSQFCHLTDNHTSAVGMRGLSTLAGALTIPLNHNEIYEDKNKDIPVGTEENCHTHHLFCYPAQSNFSGTKYPFSWIKDIKSKKLSPFSKIPGKWYVLMDAASFVSTSPLDLGLHQADFIPISFYKIFGFPTGLGALLVKNESGQMLRKRYFGGGTSASYLSGEDFYVPKQSISDRFEDGTISFLDIIAVNHGFDALDKFTGGMQNIMLHTFSLARYTYIILSGMRHANGTPVSRIYSDNKFETPDAQGPIINMNVLDEKGGIVGYAKVDKLANLYNIHLRTGCFCNTGGCQQHLGISDEDVKKNLKAGHVCGDSLDLIDGRPTGSVRISFGYMSTFDDAQTFLKFIINCFVKQPVCFDNGILSKLTQCGTMKESDESWAENLPDGKAKKMASEIAIAHNSARTEDPLYQNSSDNQSELNKNSTTSKLMYYDSEPITLANIYLYPIKSCAAVEVKKWPIGKQGLLYDRNWMIVNQNGVCLSQKQEPRLCLIHPHIDLDQGIMTINAEGMDPIIMSLEEEDGKQLPLQFCQTKVCGDRVKGLDCGENVARWISAFLGRRSFLIRQCSNFHRTLKKQHMQVQNQALIQSPSLSLVNEAQYLLINKASILHLKEQILQRGGTCDSNSAEALTTEELIHRFRANLVISTMRPYEEDDWAVIDIGGVSFQIVGLCSRCQMICINQENGKRSTEPLQTLYSSRDRKMTFGAYLLHQPPATSGHCAILAVGSQAYVRKREKRTTIPSAGQ